MAQPKKLVLSEQIVCPPPKLLPDEGPVAQTTRGLSHETLADLQRFVKEGRIGAGMEEEPPKT